MAPCISWWRLAALCIGASIASPTVTEAITIVGYDPATHDRFSGGYPNAPIPNPSPAFLGSGMNFAGVGWNPALPTQSFAMISNQHFVFASHYAPGIQISFLSPLLLAANPGNPSAAVVTVGVSSIQAIPSVIPGVTESSDFSIGTLSAPLDNAWGIPSYPILLLSSLNAYIGLEVLLYGHGGMGTTNSPRIASNEISSLDDFFIYHAVGSPTAESFGAGYAFNSNLASEGLFQSGDSGSPNFVNWHGQLSLIGTHSAVGTVGDVTYSVDNFIPVYLDRLQALSIPFTTVPEPRHLFWIGAACVWARRRRRYQR